VPGLPDGLVSGEAEQAQHLVVDEFLGDRTAADRFRQGLSPERVGPRHRQVETAHRGRDRAAVGVPVRGDHAGEAPFVLEDLAKQPLMLGHRAAVDRVVRGHDQRRACLPDAGLEGDEVQLAQHLLGDPRVIVPALGLRIVADIVLDGRRDPGRLHTAHVRHGEARGQFGVLGEELEAPAAERGPDQVEGWCQQHIDPFAAGLDAQGGAELVDELAVPGGTEGRRAGEASCWLALVHGDAAHPGRPVRHDHRTEAEGVGAVCAPAVRTGQQAHLLLNGERSQQAALLRRRGANCHSRYRDPCPGILLRTPA